VAHPCRVAGLDGIRGLAALFVVLNHVFERAWPGFPVDHAPLWAGEFIYGRFAVVVFIALSGFSLGLAPARSGWRFDSVAAFARRRAWRILPPYWAALAFSLVLTWFVVAQPGWAVPDGKSVVVYGLLAQDAVAAGSPNRAFWSIAVEAQLYVLLPLLLLLVRRVSATAMVALVAAVVVTVGVLGPHVAPMDDVLVRSAPDLAVVFALGVLAAGIATASERTRSRPWAAFAVAAAAPVVALIAVRGSTWTDQHLFWVDLAWGPAIGCLLAAVATARPWPLVQLLDSRPLRGLGSFSYSLYLTHAPIVIAVSYGLVLGRVPAGTPTFLVLTAVLLPLTVGFARLFAAAFELPFQRHRGWAPLRRAVGRRLALLRRPAREVQLVRDVHQLTAGQLTAALRRPAGDIHRPRAILQRRLDRLQDAVQEDGLVGRVPAVGAGVHDPVGCARGQRRGTRGAQVAEETATRPALTGRPAVADALVHGAVIGPQDLVVVGVVGLEDAVAVEVDREPVRAARGQQPEQPRQDGRHVHEIQERVGDQQVGRLPGTVFEVVAELGLHESHPQVTHAQPVRQRVGAQPAGTGPVAEPGPGIPQQPGVDVQQGVLAGGDDLPVQQAGDHRAEAGPDLQDPRRARRQQAAQLREHVPVEGPVVHRLLRR
jgi:peptidoglycan/LPS O-acetylase OafA/YrhL